MAIDKREGDPLVPRHRTTEHDGRLKRNAAGLVLILIGFAALLYAMTVVRLIG